MDTGMISFTVRGNPKALKSHRTVKTRKFFRQYDPNVEDKADFLNLAHSKAPEKPIESPVTLRVKFFFPRPKKHYRSNGLIKPQFSGYEYSQKPDLDNLVKFIGDSLNGVFWKDDSLIYHVDVFKFYGEMPYTQIEIEW
jgi:Holliday junction resolvase RusA-like endonuclease